VITYYVIRIRSERVETSITRTNKSITRGSKKRWCNDSNVVEAEGGEGAQTFIPAQGYQDRFRDSAVRVKKL
jgi:hypothetical protein